MGGMNLGQTEFLLVGFIVGFFLLALWGIADAAKRPASVWVAAERSKRNWILVQILLGGIGAAVYLLTIRPDLRAVTAVALLQPPDSRVSRRMRHVP